MQVIQTYEFSSLEGLARRLEKLIAEGHRIVQVIHHVETKAVPYLQDRIHALVISETRDGTAE